MTQIIVSIGKIMSASYIVDAIVLVALIMGVIFIARSAKGKAIVAQVMSVMPVTKKLFRQLSLYRYCWTMGVLISSGVDILKSLDITADVLPGKNYKDAITRIRDAVAKGEQLGSAMRNEGKLFPHVISGMTNVGEKTGSLEKIYLSLSKFYDRNFSSALKTTVALMEPLLLVGMGGIVAVIALSIVLPIYQFVSGGVK